MIFKYIIKRFNIFGLFGLFGIELVLYIYNNIYVVIKGKIFVMDLILIVFWVVFRWYLDEIFMFSLLKVDKRLNYVNFNLIFGLRCIRLIMCYFNNFFFC